MAGKHQIFSSRKSTRQRANRSWRRTAKQRMPHEGIAVSVNPTLDKRKINRIKGPDTSESYSDGSLGTLAERLR